MSATIPPGLRGRLIAQWQGELRHDGDALLSRTFYDGKLNYRPGSALGVVLLRERAHNPPLTARILYIGTLRIGHDSYLVGVTPGWNGVWLGRPPTGGKGTARLWCCGAYRLRQPWGWEGSMSKWEQTLDVPIELVMEGLIELIGESARAGAQAHRELVRRYRALIEEGIDAALLYAAKRGGNVGADDLAGAVWPEWKRADLFSDRATLPECIAIALALCGPYTLTQPPDMANRAELIVSTGMLLTLDLSLADIDAIRALLRSATERIARAIPQWDLGGITTDWGALLRSGSKSDVPPAMMPRWLEQGADILVRYCIVPTRSSSGYVEQGAPSALLTMRDRQNPQPTPRDDLRRPSPELPVEEPVLLPVPVAGEERGRNITIGPARELSRATATGDGRGRKLGGRGKKKEAAPV
tara:strand:+ start:2161 stop:3402 length:1242 start_codon:yes stop_codon:yes gene_type:complete